METIKVTTRLSTEEKESVLVYDYVDKVWHAETVIPKHLNKWKKQGWKQTAEYIYDDGSVCGGAFVVPEKAVSFRNPNIKRVMSEKQMKNLLGDAENDEDDEDDED